jgi:hypothetical protein
MLNALIRISSAALLIGVAACSFGSAPVGQGSSNNSANKRSDAGAGAGADAATTTTKRRVSTRKADAKVAENEEVDMDAGEGDTVTTQTMTGDAGPVVRTPAAGASGAGNPPVQNVAGRPAINQPTQPQRSDAGVTTTAPPVTDAGPRIGDASTTDAGDAGDPIGSLEDLAKMSPSARTTATINKFLTTLSEGDAPASSIKEFLTSINAEVDCKMNGFSYECLTACEAVSTTCALCVLEDECRMTMLDICGVAALRGCIPRR